jgi:uncharacterized membrane protein
VDDVTLYEWLLFGHIAAVIAWVGGGMLLQMMVLRTRALGPERAVQLLADIEWMSVRYFIPVSLLTVALGFGLIAESEGVYDLGQTWIVLALIAYAISFFVGALYLGPESGRISKLAAERGDDDPEVQSRLLRLQWIARAELTMLVLIVLDMVVKPGL